ncbi:dephospho-CoA kinase [Microbacterium sp. zg.Y1090]|uniref:dephospho-CoA kinase n=1 Tax=Microbacterium wangruii TaxID=3049073 RepID=UPI00214D1848|nr:MULTISPECIES: dephospho-CoA kinase [unclassified Microbacterium]MCR2819824.1 dephospho-CoA kinase [Microbacterium sp. zg.Y1090]MDL5487935.1 dephospho-CoA kinase [Microbacterium sp. zg-Y1211]WIM28619.1 dephospho-CoA kinase [Microbacterium sp. zg-Y1090]
MHIPHPRADDAAVLVGLTGGIAAGKSTIARALAERGARIIDADAIARWIVDPDLPEGRTLLEDIAALLGRTSLTAEGALDRDRVASIVFGDDDLRRRYNAIVHPALRREIGRTIDRERRRGPGVVVHEYPLLTRHSPPVPWTYDVIVTVEADADLRIRRLQDSRGLSAADARRRVAAQGDEADRVAIADIVIRTDSGSGDTPGTSDTVAELWRLLTNG